MKKLMVVLVLALAGCCSDPTRDEVTQERAIYDVVQPRDVKYTQADPALSPAQKQDVLDLWQAYDSWLQDRERRAGVRK